MPIGRNDPCPCGSGKKYKRCHGAAPTHSANPDVVRANSLKTVDIDLGTRLLRFARLRFGAEWLSGALDEYSGSSEGGVSQHELTLAIPWAFHVRRDERGLTAADVWAADRASRLTESERTLLRAYESTWLSMWEITRVDRGVGVALVDQLTREERFAYDVSASNTVDIHDVMLAMVLDCDGVAFFGGVHPQPLPPRYADTALRAARKIFRVRTRPVALDVLRDCDAQLEMVDVWNEVVDAMFGAPPPTLSNTDGDLLTLTTDDFEIKAPHAEIIDRLASIDGAAPPEDEGGETVIVFIKPDRGARSASDGTIIGRVAVGKKSVRVETNSARRADALRARIEQALGGRVVHRLRQETNTADLMARAAARGPASPRESTRETQPPEFAAMIRQLREAHMRSWIDESIPLLGGLTPREAARQPRSRAALEVLLKDIERDESRLPPGERIDISWMRPELGLR